MKQCCQWGKIKKKKSLTILHTEHRTPSFPPISQPKGKNWDFRKKRVPHQKQETKKKKEIERKTGYKVKVKKI